MSRVCTCHVLGRRHAAACPPPPALPHSSTARVWVLSLTPAPPLHPPPHPPDDCQHAGVCHLLPGGAPRGAGPAAGRAGRAGGRPPARHHRRRPARGEPAANASAAAGSGGRPTGRSAAGLRQSPPLRSPKRHRHCKPAWAAHSVVPRPCCRLPRSCRSPLPWWTKRCACSRRARPRCARRAATLSWGATACPTAARSSSRPTACSATPHTGPRRQTSCPSAGSRCGNLAHAGPGRGAGAGPASPAVAVQPVLMQSRRPCHVCGPPPTPQKPRAPHIMCPPHRPPFATAGPRGPGGHQPQRLPALWRGRARVRRLPLRAAGAAARRLCWGEPLTRGPPTAQAGAQHPPQVGLCTVLAPMSSSSTPTPNLPSRPPTPPPPRRCA